MKETLNAWIHAARLRTLPLSVAGVIMGSALALDQHKFNVRVFSGALLTTLLLQILSNLANDYGDFSHGTDNDQRVGPKRAVQSGRIKPKQMRIGIIITATLALISGLWLLWSSFTGNINVTFLIFVGMGLASIVAAIKYTVGKNPFGYKGLGDVMVFLFFGIVAVAGTYFLHAKSLPLDVLLPATSVGLLSVGVLNINNMRDVENDKTSGKFTIPVRFGITKSKGYHLTLLIVSMLSLDVYFVLHESFLMAITLIIPFILLIWHGIRIMKNKHPHDFDPELKRLSLTTLLIACWCGIGILL